LEITIAHAVTKPMVRVDGTDLTAAGWVSVVIRREFYSTLLLHNAEHPRFNGKDRTKDGKWKARSLMDESRLSYRPV
jgi:hypothetical protein